MGRMVLQAPYPGLRFYLTIIEYQISSAFYACHRRSEVTLYTPQVLTIADGSVGFS